ncbi:hypothetical protein C8R47DRAFT_1093477 [Mycena vitilis]|nr:hypothetical protein C8R47DRAFT_1093477 [Mycena vitilis]
MAVMRLFPAELVELIIYHAWGYISTSSHRHAHCMASWMLVSRDWLKIVVFVVFRDLWITSRPHLKYIRHICRSNTSFVCKLAGIMDIHNHLAQTCRSLTISVYHSYEQEYAAQCAELIEYAATDSHRLHLLSDLESYKTQTYTVPCQSIATVIRDFTPRITVLHFVLLDCTATYGAWDTSEGLPYLMTKHYPLSLTELHITFAYTSPPPSLLLDAPRGTFFPPPAFEEMPPRCCFEGVRRLVIWDANADFVAFMTTACPRLERVESTAEFRAKDAPDNVSAEVKARLMVVRLQRTATWGLTGHDRKAIPHRRQTTGEWWSPSAKMASIPPAVGIRKQRNPIWRFLEYVFRERK